MAMAPGAHADMSEAASPKAPQSVELVIRDGEEGEVTETLLQMAARQSRTPSRAPLRSARARQTLWLAAAVGGALLVAAVAAATGVLHRPSATRSMGSSILEDEVVKHGRHHAEHDHHHQHHHHHKNTSNKCHGAGCACDCKLWGEDACGKDSGDSRCAKQCCGDASKQCKSRGGCRCDCSWKSEDACRQDDGGCCWSCCCGSSFLGKQNSEEHCFGHEEKKSKRHKGSKRREDDEEASVQISRPVSVYCWMVMMADSYEVDLVKMQLKNLVGIFACDAYSAYSNKSIALGDEVYTSIIPDGSGNPISLKADMYTYIYIYIYIYICVYIQICVYIYIYT